MTSVVGKALVAATVLMAAGILWWLVLLPGSSTTPPAADVPGNRGAESLELPFEDINVLLIVVDTLGAAHVGCACYEQGTTPHLDRLGRIGAVFEHAYSTAPWTKPALASIFTGLLPSTHGVQEGRDLLAQESVVLAEVLRDRGFATAGIVSHMLVSTKHGYAQGFDDFDEVLALSSERNKTSAKVTDKAIAWLDLHRDEPFFLFLHYFDPHYSYLHHPELDRTDGYDGPLDPGFGIWRLRGMRERLTADDIDYLEGLYHEEIAFTDQQIGRLLAQVNAFGIADRTLVVVTADHGEEFMQRGWIGHTRTLYDELIHVPLVFSLPGMIEPTAITTPVSTMDIAPTITSLTTGADIDGAEGFSLVPFLLRPGEAGPARSIIAEVSYRQIIKPWQTQKVAYKSSLVSDRLKVIHNRLSDTWEVYDLSDDAGERANLVDHIGDRSSKLVEELLAWEQRAVGSEAAAASQWQPSEEELERMRALGYTK